MSGLKKCLGLGLSNHSYTILNTFIRGLRSSALKSKTKSNNKMDKRRLKMTLKVLDEVKFQFRETKQFMEECIEQEFP